MATKAEQEAALFQYWMGEIDKAKRREKDYRKQAKKIIRIYEADTAGEETPFNILYSNTETLAPALYNTKPRPDVKPKNKKSVDPTVVAAAQMGQKLLEAMLDSGSEDDTTPDSVFKQAVHEGLVPGRGNAWAVYEADVSYDEQGQPSAVNKEYVCLEELPWDRFLCGYAKKWSKVPWVAAIWYFTREELEKKFGKEALAGVEFKPTAMEQDDDPSDRDRDAEKDKPMLACVYEIWDKSSRTVTFVSDSVPDRVLKREDDPLGLVNFFPCPEPLTFFRRISSNTPVPLYQFYEQQAEELNDITARIMKIVRTIRVRGAYDSTLEEMERVLLAKDGDMIPLQNVASLGNGQGANLANAIWYQPLKEPIIALQQLYAQREQIKGVIYEVTGVSDILRGASQASETATAQNIKNQWGTLRLKRAQTTVATFCRDALRIMLEIAVSRLSPQTIMQMTDMKLPTQEQKAQAQALAQQAQVAGQQPPPEIAQLLGQPTIDEVLGLLQNDLSRSFKVDIETNSTVDVEATEDKKDFSELLNAISQFMNGVAPLIADGAMPMSTASVILLSIVRRFRMGTEVEDEIMAMGKQPPKQEKEDPKAQAEAQKAQMELQKMQMQGQMDERKAQREEAMAMREMQLKEQELAMRERQLVMEMEFKQEEYRLKRAELQAKTQAAITQARLKPKGGANANL